MDRTEKKRREKERDKEVKKSLNRIHLTPLNKTQ